MRELYHQHATNGLLVFFRLTPNARQNEIVGLLETSNGPVVGAIVRAIPDKGKANKALIALASTWLGVPKSLISLKSGRKSRLKTLLVQGEASALANALDVALGVCEKQQ